MRKFVCHISENVIFISINTGKTDKRVIYTSVTGVLFSAITALVY